MRGMRSGEDHGLDALVSQKSFVRVGKPDAMGCTELSGLRGRPSSAGREADDIALALDGRDEVLAPGPEADDCRLDHRPLIHRPGASEAGQSERPARSQLVLLEQAAAHRIAGAAACSRRTSWYRA